jgi:hypothetical protein
MPSSAQVSVTTTPVLIASTNGAPKEIHLHCASGNVYLDSAGVTSSNGYRMDSGQVLMITLTTNEELWAVASTGTSTLYVLTTIL